VGAPWVDPRFRRALESRASSHQQRDSYGYTAYGQHRQGLCGASGRRRAGTFNCSALRTCRALLAPRRRRPSFSCRRPEHHPDRRSAVNIDDARRPTLEHLTSGVRRPGGMARSLRPSRPVLHTWTNRTNRWKVAGRLSGAGSARSHWSDPSRPLPHGIPNDPYDRLALPSPGRIRIRARCGGPRYAESTRGIFRCTIGSFDARRLPALSLDRPLQFQRRCIRPQASLPGDRGRRVSATLRRRPARTGTEPPALRDRLARRWAGCFQERPHGRGCLLQLQ